MPAVVLQQPMFRRLLPAFLIATLLLPGLPKAALCAEPAGKGTHAELVALFKEFQAWQASGAAGVTTDYSPAAIEKRKAQLGAFQARLADMGVASWQKAEQVDYLIVRAELDKEHFIQQVTRPWARDPVFYVAELQEVPFAEVPASGENLKALQRRLRAIPGYLTQARSNLTDVAADYADLAISLLERSDGVEAGYPYRAVPPPGVVGWYDDLLQRADKQRSLKPEIERAKTAIVEFQSWLEAGRPQMNARAGVGEKRLDWFLKNALLLPYDSAQVEVLGERELERMWAFYALERHRNRGLPELQRAKDRFEYGLRLAQTDKLVRNWLVEQQWISIPDYIPVDLEVMGYNVPFIERETAPNFWEQVQYRDPVPDHLHAVIPGHRFDNLMKKNNPHPIRGQVQSGSRWQGWAVYLEEGPLQAGILETRPRARELIYIFGLWRAARTLGDVRNQLNQMNAQQTVQWWMEVTPLLDANVARKYAHLRPAPGHGLEYTMGNLQMFSLLAEKKRQMGEKFVLKDFHDEFMTKGQIPIALIRWEMTGYDKDVKKFWEREPLE